MFQSEMRCSHTLVKLAFRVQDDTLKINWLIYSSLEKGDLLLNTTGLDYKLSVHFKVEVA